MLFSAGLTGIGLRHHRESVPLSHSLRAPPGRGSWLAQAAKTFSPIHFQASLSLYPAAFPGSEIPHNPRKPSIPSPPASVSPAAISFALSGCSHHPRAPPHSCCQRPKHRGPLQPPRCATRPIAALGASPSCGKDGVSVPLTKLKMSPRSCGAGRAGTRSSRARSRQGGSTLAMVGSFVPLPQGRRVLYSRRLHQLMWLLLSHPNSWHWGSATTPCLGQENSDARAAGQCHDGDVSPCPQVTVPHRRCQPALSQLLWPKRTQSNGTPALPLGGISSPPSSPSPWLQGAVELGFSEMLSLPGAADGFIGKAKAGTMAGAPLHGKAPTPRSSIARTLCSQAPRNLLGKAQSVAGASPPPC